VEAFLDRNANDIPDRPEPVGTNRIFDFPLDLTQDPTNYQDAAIVQQFYWLNWYHDRLYDMGFTEAAGNYQQTNFNRGGIGNDNIRGHVQDGAAFGQADNSFFQGGPDGFHGIVHMFIFSGPNPNRDGSLDNEVLLHEVTHGTSGRLVGGGVGISQLQTAGMGEGWSDFFAISLLSQPGDDQNGQYAAGGYASFNFVGISFANYYFGIRHYPYTTDMSKNPFTFKDIDPAQISSHPGSPFSPIYSPFSALEADEVHHQGEVWCVTLWDARANLVTKYGYPGNQIMLQDVVDGMKLGPIDPNFLQARDAILLADQVDNGGANYFELWEAFAKRGMGVNATSPDSSTTAGVVESYELPGLSVTGVTVSGGNGNGVIDFNECNNLQITLVNNDKVSANAVSVRLVSTTTNVIIAQPLSFYPDFAPGATNVNSTPFKISTSPNFVCGTPIVCSLIIKTDQSTRTNQLILPTGTAGPPLRFDNSTPVAIPDNNPAGVSSSVTVTNVMGAIGKVTVSLFITHTFDSDLTIQLISPDGVTNTLSANNGGSGDNYGLGCSPDASRTTFDDDASVPIGASIPPFVGSFKPDQALSIFNGKSGSSANGVWQLHVVDGAAFDVGVLQCWSLMISSPTCSDGGGECPGADLAVTISAQPEPVILGNNLFYTLTVVNNGPSTAKNVVVSQVLPPSVIFQYATPSQGGAAESGGIVTCDVGTLNAKGSATIIVAVIPTATGAITTSATATSNQPDFDSSNNNPVLTSHVLPPTSDLVIGFTAAPANALVGGALTYTASVTNNGPSPATGLTVTNTFPSGISLLGAIPSQGSATIISNTVVCSFGTVPSGGRVTVNISATPTSQGSFTATATATANQFDPILGNNTASATVIVGAASDLGISIVDSPDPVVVRSNVTYVVAVTNRGPSTATSVVVNNTLPLNVILVSTNSSQGTITRSGNTVTCNLGTMVKGGSATITIVVTPTNSGPISVTSTVSAIQGDPNPADNSATATTVVAAPFLSIAAAGATLTAESISPPNGVVDIGETVSVTLRLRNVGNVRNTNLVATLLAANGVTPVGNPQQTYGVLLPSGFPVGRSFSFTASGVNAGTVTAVLQLKDGTNNLGTASYVFYLPDVRVFSNTAAITIRDNTNALPYPSIINVSGLSGTVGKVTATLSNLNHTFPQDIDALLVGPSGQASILMSGAGAPPVSGADVTFDDSASAPIPDGNSQIISGSYTPADYLPGQNLLPPAPAGPYTAAMTALNTSSPNGQWSLYVDDHTAGDVGNIFGGWSLSLALIVPVNQVADLALSGSASPDPSLEGDLLTYTFNVTNTGPNNASFVVFTNNMPPGAAFISASASQGSLLTNGTSVIANLGPMSAGASATVTVTVSPTVSGLLTNTATVSTTETDLNPANNTVTIASTVNVPVADAGLSVAAAPNPVVVGSNLTYTCSVTNLGPQTALNVVLTDPLPPGVNFVNASCSVGLIVNGSGTVTCNFGNLASGAAATATIIVSPSAAGSITNVISLATASSDTNSGNNSVSSVVVAANPAPIIAAAGARLISESFSPPNGAIDPGEQVTLALSLQNVGSLNTANLVASLQASGGVTPVGNPLQTYGALQHGGAAVSQPFTFTASGAGGSPITATLLLSDGGQSLGSVSFTFTLSTTASLSNTASIIIPDHGPASPYPSTIVVSGQTGVVSKVTATLFGLGHSFPRDINAMLISPAGGAVMLMSHVGSAYALTNVTLTFDDAASASLPLNSAIASGTYLPTAAGGAPSFPPPSPAGLVPGTMMAALNGANPNGTWSLYVLDDSVGDAGQIAGGWGLNITVVTTVNAVADLGLSLASAPGSVFVGSAVTNVIGVTNGGPAAASGVVVSYALGDGAVFGSATPSQGSFAGVSNGVVRCNLGGISAGGSASVTVIVSPSLNGSMTNAATVSANESDLNLANNSAQTVTTVISPAPVRLSGSATNGHFEISGTGQPGLSYAIQISTNFTSWLAIGTNVANAGGTFKFVDVNANNFDRRFYRAVRLLP
jgi:uncharacterized repeat protein (TIGR01451 family)